MTPHNSTDKVHSPSFRSTTMCLEQLVWLVKHVFDWNRNTFAETPLMWVGMLGRCFHCRNKSFWHCAFPSSDAKHD